MYLMNDAGIEVPGRIADRTVHRLVYGGGDDSDGVTFTVHRWPVEPGADAEELAAESGRAAARRLAGYEVVGRSRREADGLPVAEVRYTWTGDDGDVYAREAHLVVRGVWLRFTARGALDTRDVCDAAIERVIATFRARG
jgi:hypothetical protein